MRLVFLGPPGVGKGTIAEITKDAFCIPHISTGDLFRRHIKQETHLGTEVKKILASGELVPDSITIDMVKERLKDQDAQKGFILDGFPRTIAQADALKEITDIDYALNFTAPKELIIKRLSGRRVAKHSGKIYHMTYNPPKEPGKCDITGEPLIQRPDDQEEAIAKRLNVYHDQTAPLIDYYQATGLLRDIDSSGTPETIFAQVLETLQQSGHQK